jgi:proteasome lid subunit RPN8/RPN11
MATEIPLARNSIVLFPEILEELKRIALERSPNEACGVLLPTPRGHNSASQVVELPNRSMQHHDSYQIYPSDIHITLAEWIEDSTVEDVGKMAVWHSHPGGNVGPSADDLKMKVDGLQYLVVTLTAEQELIPCWF